MTAEQTLAVVRRSVTVTASVEKAFAVFTESFGSWWPAGYHINPDGYESAFIEARVGGRWFERAPDGTESVWGRVLEWDPPARILLTWQLSSSYVFEPDRSSEVEITFTAEDDGRTRVDLVHRGIDRLTGADEVAKTVGGDGGWSAILARFAAALEA